MFFIKYTLNVTSSPWPTHSHSCAPAQPLLPFTGAHYSQIFTGMVYSAAWLTKIIIYEIRMSISVQLQLESALSAGMQMYCAESWAAHSQDRTDSKSNHRFAMWFLLWMLSTITRKSKRNRNKAQFYVVYTVFQRKAEIACNGKPALACQKIPPFPDLRCFICPTMRLC